MVEVLLSMEQERKEMAVWWQVELIGETYNKPTQMHQVNKK